MNVYVYNCPNTFNYGSMMMGENFISYFNKMSGKKNKYFVETTDDIIEAKGVKEIYPVPMKFIFKEGTKRYDYLLACYWHI